MQFIDSKMHVGWLATISRILLAKVQENYALRVSWPGLIEILVAGPWP